MYFFPFIITSADNLEFTKYSIHLSALPILPINHQNLKFYSSDYHQKLSQISEKSLVSILNL